MARQIAMTFSLALNMLSGNILKRMKPYQYRQYRDKIQSDVLSALWDLPIVQKYKKAEIVITRFGPKSLDTDNLYFSAKPLVDCLKNIAIIPDDSPDVLTLKVQQEKSIVHFVKIEINGTPLQ